MPDLAIFNAGNWFQWLGQFTADPSNIIAAAALLVSFVSAWSTSKHALHSVVPAFSVWATYPGPGSALCTVTLSNKGFGPAIVESFEVFLHGRKGDGPHFERVRNVVREAIGDGLVTVHYVGAGEKGHAIGAGEHLVIAKFEVTKEVVDGGTERMSRLMRPLALVVRYRDIYERPWVFITDEFDGCTFRDDSIRPRALRRRFRYRALLREARRKAR